VQLSYFLTATKTCPTNHYSLYHKPADIMQQGFGIRSCNFRHRFDCELHSKETSERCKHRFVYCKSFHCGDQSRIHWFNGLL